MSKPWFIAIVGAIAAVCLLAGGFTLTWWSHPDGEFIVQVGLREAAMCRSADGDSEVADGCSTVALNRLVVVADLLWVRAGIGAYAAAWMASMLSLAVAGIALARRRWTMLARTALVASVGALAAALAFVVLVPDNLARGPGIGMFSYFIGATLALVNAVLVLRQPDPASTSKR